MVECQKPESILGEQSSAWLNKCKLSATTKRINVKTAVCLRQVASSESDDLERQHKIGRSPLLMMMTALKARRRPAGENKQVYHICYRYCKVLPQLLLLLSSSTALLLPLLWHCYDILQPEVLSATSATTPAAYQSPATHTNNDTSQMRAVYKTPNSAASVAIQLLFIRVSKYCSWVALLISALNLGSTSPNAIFEKSSKNILHWCRCRRTLSGHPFFQSLTFCLGKTWFLLSTFSCEWMCFITSV